MGPKGIEQEKLRLERLNKTHICKVCGKEYTIRDYMKSIGTRYERNSGYCSAECKREFQRNNSNTKRRQGNRVRDKNTRRARMYGCKFEKGITLKKLIERDGLRCAICGEMCDWNDHSWNKNCGPLYPSMDHIIPMCKGGGHTWDNVQVVHMICNDRKFTSVS